VWEGRAGAVAVAEGVSAGELEFATPRLGLGVRGNVDGMGGFEGVVSGMVVGVAVRMFICMAVHAVVAVAVGDGSDRVGNVVCFGISIGGPHTHHPSWIRVLDHDNHPYTHTVVTAE